MKKEISEYMSKIAKKGHKKSPRPPEFYKKMGKKSALKRWGQGLSTDETVQ